MLEGYKTYIVAGLTIAYAVAGMALGFVDPATGAQMIAAALGFTTIRHGMKTGA